MQTIKIEQWINLEYLVKCNKFVTQSYQLLKKVYGNAFMSESQVCQWYKRFVGTMQVWTMTNIRCENLQFQLTKLLGTKNSEIAPNDSRLRRREDKFYTTN